MPKRNQLQRALTFARKRWDALKGKPLFTSDPSLPRVLINSVPKAGTNLGERAVQLLPGMKPSGIRTLMDWRAATPGTLRAIRRLRPGRYRTAHLPFYPAYLEAIEALGVRVLFIIRDPRDVVVSHMRYVTSLDRTHRSHRYMASLASDHERLLAVITGVDGLIAPVDEVWRRYVGWLDAPHTLVVRFEELIGPRGGGSAEAQLRVAQAILAHLGWGSDEALARHVADHVFSTDVPTFRKGAIGSWRDAFTEVHTAELRRRTGDLLVRLGYEANATW